MCFSAHASFIAAGLLSVIGCISLYKADTWSKQLLAFTPLLFAVQQAIEGFLWLLLPHTSLLSSLFTYGYLFFAYMLWPVYVPFLILNQEKGFGIKIALYATFIVGVLIALFLGKSLLLYGATATIVKHQITYTLVEPISFFMSAFLTCLYAIATIVPFFIARKPYFWFFGTMLSITYLISFIFYYHAFGSVWCFFAALLSCSTIYYMYAQK